MARKSGDKYKAIIDAAVKVIAQNGYHSSQVSKIAREAGVADGTIYLYFQNKEDVLISLFKVKMGEFTETVKKELEKLSDPFEKLAKLITLHFSILENDRDLALVLQIQLRQSEHSIRQGIAQPLKEYYNVLEQLLRDGIEKGSFRADLDVRVARMMLFGTMDEVATCWVLSQKPYILAQQVKPVYNLLAGTLARKENT